VTRGLILAKPMRGLAVSTCCERGQRKAGRTVKKPDAGAMSVNAYFPGRWGSGAGSATNGFPAEGGDDVGEALREQENAAQGGLDDEGYSRGTMGLRQMESVPVAVPSSSSRSLPSIGPLARPSRGAEESPLKWSLTMRDDQ
jgi:hypothetical protein